MFAWGLIFAFVRGYPTGFKTFAVARPGGIQFVYSHWPQGEGGVPSAYKYALQKSNFLRKHIVFEFVPFLVACCWGTPPIFFLQI